MTVEEHLQLFPDSDQAQTRRLDPQQTHPSDAGGSRTTNETSSGTAARLRAFIITAGVMSALLVTCVFMSLPSNVILGQSSLRFNFNVIASEQFPFFTKSPESMAVGLYRIQSDGQVTDLRLTPQGRMSNWFGLSRKQRAQGPEGAFLANDPTVEFTPCGGSPEKCITDNADAKTIALVNTSPMPTLCGELFLTEEYPVPFEYRKLVQYSIHATGVARVDVKCVK